LIVDTQPDWLTERLVERRLLVLAGELDRDAANRLVAELALLDASRDEPVMLRLSGVSADLDTALMVVDALNLMGVPVQATCLGTITGGAVAILAVADRRTAGAHATVHLHEPPVPPDVAGRDLARGRNTASGSFGGYRSDRDGMPPPDRCGSQRHARQSGPDRRGVLTATQDDDLGDDPRH
jgi:hypothetical protein